MPRRTPPRNASLLYRSRLAPLAPLAAAIAASAPLACGGPAESAPTGSHEPIVVRYDRGALKEVGLPATFFEGPLPNGADGPAIEEMNSQNTRIVRGQSGKVFRGVAALEATAVALRLEDVGTGYWLLPVDDINIDIPGTPRLNWESIIDFAYDVPPGTHRLSAVAVDEAGRFGPRRSLDLQLFDDVPVAPLVVSLAWNTNADLDLHLVDPAGNEIDPKHLTTDPDPSTVKTLTCGALPAGTGVLDRDADADCEPEGRHEEDVVFCGAPPPGVYLVRVDMFSACAEAYADFTIRVLSNGAELDSRAGRLLSIDADGGGPGLSIMNFTVQ